MAKVMSSQEVMQEVARRYLHDAEFHAKVSMTLGLLKVEGQVMDDPDDRALALHAAGVALIVAETSAHIGSSSDPADSKPHGQL